MICKEQMLPILLDACPEFRAQWEEHLRYWGEDTPGLYIDLAEFVGFLFSACESGQTAVVERAFSAFERFFVEGDATVQEYAALGLIESLQNRASHHHDTGHVFVPFLGPQSLREWNAIDEAWRQMMRQTRGPAGNS